MRKIREVLRLKWIAEASARQIAKSCNIARSTVKEYLKRAQDAGLTWPMACELDDASLEDLLYHANTMQLLAHGLPHCSPGLS